MKSYIYRCSRKPDMYLYLAEQDDFSKIPEHILNSLGTVEFALELELNADKKLAREDPAAVIKNLEKEGFHLQLPDKTPIEELMKQITRGQ